MNNRELDLKSIVLCILERSRTDRVDGEKGWCIEHVDLHWYAYGFRDAAGSGGQDKNLERGQLTKRSPPPASIPPPTVSPTVFY